MRQGFITFIWCLALGLVCAPVLAQLKMDTVADNESAPLTDLQAEPAAVKEDYLASYLELYLAQNLLDRSDISRKLVSRGELDRRGRLANTALYRSLGYRLRESFVAMPPPFDTHPFLDQQSTLVIKDVEQLEQTWALLDSTYARLQSKGVGQAETQHWVIAITRRNLLQEALFNWFHLGQHSYYTRWLASLQSQNNQLFENITRARQNYDVQDLRDQELVLFDLRTDLASLYQYYASEQARLFNRISLREVPGATETAPSSFSKSLICSARNSLQQQGTTYLQLRYRDLFEQELSKTQRYYRLGEIARELSIEVLRLHAQRTSKEFDTNQTALSKAQAKQQDKLAVLAQAHELMRQQGHQPDSQEREKLAQQALDYNAVKLPVAFAERQLKAAIYALTDIVLDELLSLSQTRLQRLISKDSPAFFSTKIDTWKAADRNANTLRSILLDVYQQTWVDYLLGYERAVFISLAMQRNCSIDARVHRPSMATPKSVLSEIAALARSYHQPGFPVQARRRELARFDRLLKAMKGDELDLTYPPYPLLVNPGQPDDKADASSSANELAATQAPTTEPEAPSAEVEPESVSSTSFKRDQAALARFQLKLATRAEVFEKVAGEGFTLQVVTTGEPAEIARILRRLDTSAPTLIYRSTRARSSEMVFKVVVGFTKDFDVISDLKEQLGRGWIKPYKVVRADIYD